MRIWRTMRAWIGVLALVLPLYGAAWTITPRADVTVTGAATLVAAGNGNRTALSCTNTSSSVHVRWGSSAVTASTGQQIRATATIAITNLGAVYMISEGANVTVSCTEELQ